jgi:glycosyltransferase involved in cell wall biosynthesis
LAVKFNTFLEAVALALSNRIYVVSFAFQKLVLDTHQWMNASKIPRVKRPKLLYELATKTAEPLVDSKTSALSLVCVRRLVKRTGVQELVIAFGKAYDQQLLHPDTILNIVGQGPEFDSIALTIKSLSCANNIVLLGKLSDQKRTMVFQNADWNIVPTQYLEGFGLVVLEAALEGCPSLVTNVDALPEVIGQLKGFGQICEPQEGFLIKALASLKKLSPADKFKLADLASRKYKVTLNPETVEIKLHQKEPLKIEIDSILGKIPA